MENMKLSLDLPPDVFTRLENCITQTVQRTLAEHVRAIQAEPKRLTREETAAALRVSLPTLRSYETAGKLIPRRAGRRVLYNQSDIDRFLGSGRA